ncbi:MAG: class I SAM-dependent methyltransferase [Cyclobacteriaceae bacterium]|nr:class I SAM-dependent methyltransferase [Cyclobacteriaceae bacterium]MDW8331587.1 class I SAM-dependent methyltransferase [Cyclobacteriaceae bacterium]
MDQRSHWNTIAPVYRDEIFDVFASDRKGILKKYFRKYRNTRHTAFDFGCGIGKAFPYLAPSFKQVVAMDISDRCLSEARNLNYRNLSFRQADLTDETLKLPRVHFVFCCNVIMLPDPEKNLAMFRNIRRSLKKGGAAVIIVPSLESYLFSAWRLIDWYRQEGIAPDHIDRDELSGFLGNITDTLQGIVTINGVITKHYTAPELNVILPRAGLRISKLDKVEYNWDTEFSDPPSWMREPYPWDWLIECN